MRGRTLDASACGAEWPKHECAARVRARVGLSGVPQLLLLRIGQGSCSRASAQETSHRITALVLFGGLFVPLFCLPGLFCACVAFCSGLVSLVGFLALGFLPCPALGPAPQP